MSRHRHLTPLLVTVLVVQSVVAVLPHAHHSTVDGQAWQEHSSFESAHHCLACAVQAPVVAPAGESCQAFLSAITSPVAVDRGSTDILSILDSAGPRGPPSGV